MYHDERQAAIMSVPLYLWLRSKEFHCLETEVKDLKDGARVVRPALEQITLTRTVDLIGFLLSFGGALFARGIN